MGMRLLPKSEFEKAKSNENRREVEEGLKLARRVDNLREVAAQEEASLEKFRRETVEIIHVQISTESEKLEYLKKEVSSLVEQREIAIKPLDEEWSKVREAVVDVEERQKEQEARNQYLEEKEAHVISARKQAYDLLERARQRDGDSVTRLQKAVEAEELGKGIIEDARVARLESKEAVRMASVELTHREELVTSREESATIKELDISARERALADGWKLLRDQEAMLARDLKRIKK